MYQCEARNTLCMKSTILPASWPIATQTRMTLILIGTQIDTNGDSDD